MIVHFRGYKCSPVLGHYGNGRPALRLVDINDEPIATASINVLDAEIAKGEIIIKDYSENEGMLAALVKAGIVEDTGDCVEMPYGGSAAICRLLI